MGYRCSTHYGLISSIRRIRSWMSVLHRLLLEIPCNAPIKSMRLGQGIWQTSEEKLFGNDCVGGVIEWLILKILTIKNVSKNFCHIIPYLPNKTSQSNIFIKGLWISSQRKSSVYESITCFGGFHNSFSGGPRQICDQLCDSVNIPVFWQRRQYLRYKW